LLTQAKAGTLGCGMTRLTAALTGFAVAIALPWPTGCGPSVQAVHEGNVRFEHCYRLDLDPRIAPSHRLTCWQQWSTSYSYGQSRDRLEYARRRVRSLSAGESSAMRLQLAPAEQRAPRPDEAAGAPAPTSAHAPPPPMAVKPEAERPEQDAGPPTEAGVAPFAACFRQCTDRWRVCRSHCPGTEADPGCVGCNPDYRSCVERCLR
jgi:hypothetical protein